MVAQHPRERRFRICVGCLAMPIDMEDGRHSKYSRSVTKRLAAPYPAMLIDNVNVVQNYEFTVRDEYLRCHRNSRVT